MRITASQLRRIIKEEVQRSLSEAAGGSTVQKLESMFGRPGPGDDSYSEAASIIDDTLRGLDGEFAPVYDPSAELESALSMTPAGSAPDGGIAQVMKAFFAGQRFDT